MARRAYMASSSFCRTKYLLSSAINIRVEQKQEPSRGSKKVLSWPCTKKYKLPFMERLCLQNLDRNLDKKLGNNNVVWWKLWWEAQSRDTWFGLWVRKFNNSAPKFTCFSWFLLSCWSSEKPWQWEQLNFKISGLRDPNRLHGPASGRWNITNLRLTDHASEAREAWN